MFASELRSVTPSANPGVHPLAVLGANPPASATLHSADRLAGIYRELGSRLRAQGRVAEAITAYRHVLTLRPASAEIAVALAECVKEQGQFEEAALLYTHAVTLAPADPDTCFNLAEALYRSACYSEAVDAYRRASELAPDRAQAFRGLGMALHESDQFAAAVQACRKALSLDPRCVSAWLTMGNSLRALDQFDASIEAFRMALGIDPHCALALARYSATLVRQGKLDDAVDMARAALRLDPRLATAHHQLGCALRAQSKLDEAIASLRQAIELDRHCAESFVDLGIALNDQRNYAEAVNAHATAIRLKPTLAQAHAHIGVALRELGQYDPSIGALQEALRLKPDDAQTHNQYALVLNAAGRNTEAVAAAREALRLDPDYTWALNVLGFALQASGRHDEAIGVYQTALKSAPYYSIVHDNLVYCHMFQPSATLASVKEHHVRWARQHADRYKSEWGNWRNDPHPERPLVLGFVSPDFRRHPVGEFLVRSFEELNRQGWRTICYANQVVSEQDHLTRRFRAAAGTWRVVNKMNDQDLAAQIREDQVDILFETTGHMANNRLLLFARKPAPIQITWAGWMATTGLDAIDYIIGDRYQTPPGCEHGYTERIIRMPHSFICYDPPPYAPPVAPAPFHKNGYITFGCYNVGVKIVRETVVGWAAVLRRLPTAKMILKGREYNDLHMREKLLKWFAEDGVEAKRIEFRGGTGHVEHLASYGDIDIQLDPYPFTGSTTTLESLWMGVPVVTRIGETFPSRHSSSYLSTVGLSELVTDNVESFAEAAARLVTDPERLAAIRHGLRERMQASPMCNQVGFVEALGRELREAWRGWCAGRYGRAA